ncbi:MAG: protein kinase [Myxococcaceae bacterium]|nr:protein kinase [Myxococcaceae bacterium]
MAVRYQAIGPLLAGEGSRAFLGLEIYDDGRSYPVVLVWLPEAAEADPNLLAKIQRETEHAAKLDHPNIVHVHGFGHLDEGHARVVEFADGESLRKIIERAQKVPPAIAAKIVCDAATGVHYAHVAGNDDGSPLIHGDIRPETLLVSFGGVVKVTGYGALAFAPREMGGQRVKGRRVHIAPEQIIGGRESFSLQTDVYLLGLTLFECITGKVPFSDQAEFFDHAVLTLPLSPIEPGLAPEGLEPVLAKACAKKVNDRYPNPLALREAIEAAVGTLPSNDEVSEWLRKQFPGSDEARAARRLTIDSAIAEAARKLWGDKTKHGTPVQTPVVAMPTNPSPDLTPVATPAVEKKVTQPPRPSAPNRKAPEPGIKITYQEPERPERAAPRLPWGLLLAAVIGGGAVWWLMRTSDDQLPSIKKGLPALLDAGQKTVTPPPPIADVVDAGDDDDAGEALPALPAPAPAPVDAGAPAPAPVPAPAPKPGPTVLQLDTKPNTEVTIDGKLHGRTPLKVELTPGRKVVKLENKELGINTGRVFTLKEGQLLNENITLGQGTVVLTAPAGAAVFMDGKRIGTAPMKEITVYEGAHRVLVTVGKAKWSEPFSIHSGENVRFNVELE